MAAQCSNIQYKLFMTLFVYHVAFILGYEILLNNNIVQLPAVDILWCWLSHSVLVLAGIS